MNAGDIAVLALASPGLLAAGPLALRMAKEKRESAAVLRMLAQERAAREQEEIELVDGPPDGGEPLPAEQELAPVIQLRAVA